MKHSIKTFTVLFAAATMYACNSGGNTGTMGNSDSATGSDKPAAMDQAHGTDTSRSGMASATTADPEQDFLNYVVPANAKEIIWLKAGLAHGSKEIKQHSTMMLKDHKKLEASVKDYMAKKPSMSMPAMDTANAVNINDKTGDGWNKAWTDKMVEDHNALLDKLKKAQADVKDSALNKIITSTIPVVESHLSMTKSMQDKMNKK